MFVLVSSYTVHFSTVKHKIQCFKVKPSCKIAFLKYTFYIFEAELKNVRMLVQGEDFSLARHKILKGIMLTLY